MPKTSADFYTDVDRALDAALLAREFAPRFKAEDLLHLPNRNIVLTLMIDGAPSRAFSAETMTPTKVPRQ